MDNQQNNQTPLSQEPIPQEPIPQEPVNPEPPQPVIEITPEPEIKNSEPVESIQPETKILPTEASVPAEEYQKIIDEYKSTLQPQSEPVIENVKSVESTPEPPKPVMEITPEPETTKSNPAESIQAEARVDIQPPQPVAENPIKSPEEQLKDLGITVPSTSGGGFLKVLFTFSLIIFIMVISALAFVYFKSKDSSNEDQSSKISPEPTNSALQNTETCLLNDKTYQIGESFLSADGCNTCSCQSAEVIVCTEKACAVTPTAIPTKSATKSATKLTVTPTKVATSSVKKTTPTATPSATVR